MARFSNFAPVPNVSGYGEVSNSNGANELITNNKATTQIQVNKISLSVLTAAVGGGGIIEFRNTAGVVFYTADVNSVGIKPPIDFGPEGLAIGIGKGVDMVVSGAATTQARCSVGLVGSLTLG